MERNFILAVTVQTSILLTIAYLCGLLVKHKNVKVNYTRKIYHFSVFFMPFAIGPLFPYAQSAVTTIISLGIGIFSLAIFAQPVRVRIPAVATAFMTLDRPEDRPHTLFWALSQLLASYVALAPFIIYFNAVGKASLLLIPILINAVGDGLAEPVGVRFGKNKYKTKAFFSKREYTRSVEGSACVFIVSLIVMFIFRDLFTQGQWICGLIVIPPLMTAAEAFAPHTWDSPFLMLVGGLTLTVLTQLPF